MNVMRLTNSNLISIEIVGNTLKTLDINGIENEYSLGCTIELDVSENQIKELPELPNSLVVLNCYGNQLKSLPKLPKNISNVDLR